MVMTTCLDANALIEGMCLDANYAFLPLQRKPAGDNYHELSNRVFWDKNKKKKFKSSSA